MPEVLPGHVPTPVCVIGWDGARYRAFALDATGHLNVNVLTNVNLDDALQSVATDRLQVRGENQLFSFKEVLAHRGAGNIAAAGGYWESGPVPAGTIWVVTTVVAEDTNNATTEHRYYNRHNGANGEFYNEARAFGAGDKSKWGGHVYLDAGDTIRVEFVGSLVNDWCVVTAHGYAMDQE